MNGAILFAVVFEGERLREIPDCDYRRSRLASSKRREGGSLISTSVSPGFLGENLEVGMTPGSGTYFCASCGSQLSLRENDQLPDCPRCGAAEFHRDSIFEPMQEHGQTVELAIPAAESPPDWLPMARAMLPGPGRFVACCDDGGEIRVFSIEQGWTRIGRSAAADIRLDDPSVSRRHALIVSEQPDSLRVLDDRSLNGVFLNGDLIEWARLEDGDELAIGRFRLIALER
jgi:FHA domain-containing protein/zinc ribbon family protein